MEPRLEPTDTIEVVVVARDGRTLPLPAVASFGQVATCRVRRDQVAALSEHPDVRYMSAGQRIAPTLVEICAPGAHCSTRASAPARGVGSGVVLAFLDWGVDFTHRAFRDGSGRTRLRAIWDQRDDRGNNRYGYGTVYSRAQIDQALLDDQPFASLGYAPQAGTRPSRGTHVMDIAAGSSGVGLGLAPAAELVFVHLAPSPPGSDGDLGDSVRIIEALDFVIRAAGDSPLVINMSLESTGGSQSAVALAVDHLLGASAGRAVVLANAESATSRKAIAVGAIDTCDLEPPLAGFSSGPSRDGRSPDLVAPSVAVLGARSAARGTREGTAEVVAMSGSSMASAHVAGCVAAMFSAVLPHRLSIDETRRLLFLKARAYPALETGDGLRQDRDHSTGGVQ